MEHTSFSSYTILCIASRISVTAFRAASAATVMVASFQVAAVCHALSIERDAFTTPPFQLRSRSAILSRSANESLIISVLGIFPGCDCYSPESVVYLRYEQQEETKYMPIETLYVMIGVMGPITLITAIAAILSHLPDKKD